MARWSIALLSAALLIASPAVADERYFPPEYANLYYSCSSGDAPPASPIQLLSDFEAEWFSKQLRAAREPSLYALAKQNRTSRVIRFTWLRSFHSPVTVRLSEEADGHWRIVARELTGAGGYSPGEIKRSVNRRLSGGEAGALRAILANTKLPDKAGDCALGVDGARWIIERVDSGGYHFVNAFSPQDGEVRKVGLFLLNLTGWRYKQVY